ncbi:afadin- and alpha-actinin-binding protein-like [Sitophilus oryzae]|uniref:Afadin- and alpha-actinin-binding protein-like n=1 Tax=Sitophilus oryzae TaxID=7048 RepID=A0A6J2YWN7_SITOR|nr:afadin- and alpha-actinin-binding protein-like [Sitophilus oryzae]
MLDCDESLINLDQISKDLEEIELKYSPKAASKQFEVPACLEENLIVLSKELDSLGLPIVKLEGSVTDLLQQVVKSSRGLVHIHRNALSQIKNQNLEKKAKDLKNNQAYGQLDRYKEHLEKSQENSVTLKNEIFKLERKIRELSKKECDSKDEIKRLKLWYISKQNELEHNIRKLNMENERLKEMFNQDIVTDSSRNSVALSLLKKYRVNEEIYKTTIKKLQENNRELLEEVLNLKEELVLDGFKK